MIVTSSGVTPDLIAATASCTTWLLRLSWASNWDTFVPTKVSATKNSMSWSPGELGGLGWRVAVGAQD